MDKTQIPQMISLPKILDDRGNLSFIESENHIPFKIRRSYWIYDVPGGQLRGSHAFKKQHELIVALSGSFDVVLHNGKDNRWKRRNPIFLATFLLWTLCSSDALPHLGQFFDEFRCARFELGNI